MMTKLFGLNTQAKSSRKQQREPSRPASVSSSFSNAGPTSLPTQSMPRPTPYIPPQSAQIITTDVSKIRFCCGLDFGTTYSGFAIVQMQNKDPLKLQPITPLNWPDQPPNVTGVKTPTICCYAKDDLTLDSWGFTAMKKNTMKVHKIERVKLCLEPSTPEFLKPVIPTGLNADDIIRDYLREINAYCMHTMDQMWGVSLGKGDILLDQIMYCLTVPVNWSIESHQRLRKAAFRAGLISNEKSPNLVFCYEPEAACMACIHDPDVKLMPGSEFLVVDCGGGTVDLFQCRIGQSGDSTAAPMEVTELTMGQGGFFGAANVDVAFFMFLSNLMTPLGLENVRHSPRCAAAWNNLLSQWEVRKRQFTGLESSIDEIFVPQAILRELEQTLDAQLPPMLVSGIVELDPAVMRSFFDPVLDSIIKLIQTQIQLLIETHAKTRPVLEHMFVVGGFGNSAYLRKRISQDDMIQKLVHRVRSIPSPEVAVLRGAIYAAVGDCLRSRRARQSIGVQILRKFERRLNHSVNDVIYKSPHEPSDESQWLVDCYVEPFIQTGDPVIMSSYYAKHHFSLSPGSHSADINLYASNVRHGLLHIRNDKCRFLGRVSIDARRKAGYLSAGSKLYDSGTALDTPYDFSIAIYYGRVELEVCVTDTNSLRTWRTILGHGNIHVQ